MTAYFTLKHRQRKRDGKHNIMLTVQDRTKKKRFSTKIYVEKKYFQNKHNAWIKKSHREYQYLNTLLAEFYQEHQGIDPNASIPTMAQCVDYYMSSAHFNNFSLAYKDKLHGHYMVEWKGFLEDLRLWDKPYLATTTKDIKKCIDVMKRKGLKNSTINKKIGSMRSCFEHLVDGLEIIDRNPFEKIKRLSEHVTIEAIPREEIRSIMSLRGNSYAEQQALDLWKFSFYMGGMRISDMAELEKSHIDWKERTISKKQKKTKAPTLWHVGDITESIIRSYENSTAFIFDLGYNPLDHRSVDRIGSRIGKSLKRVTQRHGLKHIGSIHTARNAFIQTAESKMNLTQVQRTAGHQNPQTTMAYLKKVNNYKNTEIENTLNQILAE